MVNEHMKISLAATALTEFWGEHNRKLVLWPAAIRNVDALQKTDNDFISVPYLLERKGDNPYYKAHLYCKKVTFNIFKILYPLLNKIHNVNYSEKFWTTILINFLYKYVSSLYHKFVFLDKYSKEIPFEYTLLSRESYYIPLTHTDFTYFIMFDFGVQQIVSEYFQIFNKKNHHEISLNYKAPEKEKTTAFKRIFQNLKSIDDLFFKIAWRYLNYVKYRNIEPSMLLAGAFLSPSVMYNVIKASKGKIKYFIAPETILKVNKKASSSLREQLENVNFGDDLFLQFLAKALQYFLPENILEDFQDVLKNLEPILDNLTKLNFIVSEDWILNDTSAFLVGLCREKGIIHLHPQHGFQYMNKCNFNWIPLTYADKFLSSGWTTNEHNSNIIPAGLSKKYKKFKINRNDKVLYVSTSGWLYPVMLYDVLSSESWLTYRNRQIEFLSDLPEYIRNKIVFRYQDFFTWKNKIPFDDIQQEKMGASEPLTISMQKYRITVIDHISTSFVESIILNNPCLIDAYKEHCPIDEIFKVIFKLMQEVGIVHTSFESDRKKLSEIYSDCESWWFSSDVQNSLDFFVDNNLKPSNDFINTLLGFIGENDELKKK